MRESKNTFLLLLLLSLILFVPNLKAQDSTFLKKFPNIKEMWDIPHKTAWQLWMWPHRIFAHAIIKDRKINYDTAYIQSYQKKLVITLPISTRFLQFSLIDFKTNNRLTFAPNLDYALGVSISSRWSSFIVNTGVKLFSNNDDTRGKTEYQDYQLNLYGRRITTDMFVQSYKGFYIQNSKSYDSYLDEKPFSIREDIKAVNMGMSTYYIFNHKKFTYKNSFTFTERQKKSAGSILFGVYYTYFDAEGSPSLVIAPFAASFDSLSLIRRGHTHNFGINLGYIYTKVFLKKCYATLSLVQGGGGTQMVYERDDNSKYKDLIWGAGKFNARLALGYDQGHYFIGSMAMFDYFLFRKKLNSTFDYSFGKFMVYVGYRFTVIKPEKKLLKRLKLINY